MSSCSFLTSSRWQPASFSVEVLNTSHTGANVLRDRGRGGGDKERGRKKEIKKEEEKKRDRGKRWREKGRESRRRARVRSLKDAS